MIYYICYCDLKEKKKKDILAIEDARHKQKASGLEYEHDILAFFITLKNW